MFLFTIFTYSLGDDDIVITQKLVDSINNDPSSTFQAVLYPKFSRMTKKDFQKFLSPVRKPPEVHSSARPVGFAERSFYNSDKRYFTGIGKEVLCDRQDGSDDSHQRVFSETITPSNGRPAQFYCDSNTKDKVSIQYFVEYGENMELGNYKYAVIPLTVYDNTHYCSSWATAVTSAMTLTLSRWSHETINLSIQFILDCDILGDPCIERPPLSAYEQFWRRYIPQSHRWSLRQDPLSPPSSQLTQSMCDNYRSCYPGEQYCKRNLIMTGVCEPGPQEYGSCPIYFLYNWRWIKSHIAEVGAVTSSILARAALFTYNSGVYSSWFSNTESPYASAWSEGLIETPDITSTTDERGVILGMLDVTIIGWGQKKANLTDDYSGSMMKQRWWYVIPHLGNDFGLTCLELLGTIPQSGGLDVTDAYQSVSGKIDEVIFKQYPYGTNNIIKGLYFRIGSKVTSEAGEIKSTDNFGCFSDTEDNNFQTGVIKFNRRFDDSNIESQAVGAVPYNFLPKPWRTPAQTWSGYTTPPS